MLTIQKICEANLMKVKKSKIKKTIFIINSHFNTSYSVIHHFAFVLGHLIEWYICSFKILIDKYKTSRGTEMLREKIGSTRVCPHIVPVLSILYFVDFFVFFFIIFVSTFFYKTSPLGFIILKRFIIIIFTSLTIHMKNISVHIWNWENLEAWEQRSRYMYKNNQTR